MFTPGLWLTGTDSDLLTMMHGLQDRMNQIFGSLPFESRRYEFPPVNISTTGDKIVVTSEIPGVKPVDLNIEVKQDVMTLSGTREDELANKKEVEVHRRERPFGKFYRAIKLPYRVDPEKVEATCCNGVLSIELARHQTDLPRKIEVKAH